MLQEGKRTITIILDCNHPSLSKTQIKDKLGDADAPLFKILLSGEKEWIPVAYTLEIPDSNQIPNYPIPQGQIQFQLQIVLDSEMPGVTFFDAEKLKEKLNVAGTDPVVRIEINTELEYPLAPNNQNTEICSLKRKDRSVGDGVISPYDVFQQLQLVNAQIDVTVCGVKNLIVQNDEGALDINSQIFPFGFYVLKYRALTR